MLSLGAEFRIRTRQVSDQASAGFGSVVGQFRSSFGSESEVGAAWFATSNSSGYLT